LHEGRDALLSRMMMHHHESSINHQDTLILLR
jgi:hypothetical protein